VAEVKGLSTLFRKPGADDHHASRSLYRLTGVQKVEGTTPILRDLTFDIHTGEFVGIAGPSGAGKTTLLNLLGGIDAATGGDIWFRGNPLSRARGNELVRLRRRIGFVFQSFNLIPHLTVLENVGLPLAIQRHGRADITRMCMDALESVGLLDDDPDLVSRRPAEISGGQQQRVAIARAIVGHPDVLLADEPTGNLDSETGTRIISLLHHLHAAGRGTLTVIMVSHDSTALQSCSRLLNLRDGALETPGLPHPQLLLEGA
jgi:putative ABC transport system ATP-binding protein